VPNDHYISRFLTQPWEVGQRVLHFYDFAKRDFGRISSESLFAKQGLHTKETDLFMNKFVEKPVSDYVKSLLLMKKEPDQPDPHTARALIAFWTLQSLRVRDAKSPGALGFTLDQFLAGGESILNVVTQHLLKEQELVVVRTNQRLFFTETGTFPIPIRRGPMLIAVPLTPNHFLALADRSSPGWKEGLQEVLERIPIITSLSIGVGHKVHRVVLLPEAIPKDREARLRTRGSLAGLRESSRLYLNVVGQENLELGLPGWEVTIPA
jgi:hypothetical protein